MKKYFLLLAIASIFAACASKESMRHDILVKEEALMQSSSRTKSLDSLADIVLKDYTSYAEKYPQDSMTPTYLIRAGQIYSSKRDFQKAAEMFNKVCVKYSNDPWVPFGLFFQGLAYSDMAQSNTNPVDKQKNADRAKSLFNDLIKKYPTHKLAENAKSLLDMVGLSDEQMLEMAIKKHHEDSIASAMNGSKGLSN